MKCESHDELVGKIAEIKGGQDLILEIVKELKDKQEKITLKIAKNGGIGIIAVSAFWALAKILGVDLGVSP